MRLDRPVGSLLLLWPTLAALWLAAGGTPQFHLIVVFTVGVLVMRTAGCVVNDLADRHLDPLVERTKDRPLATRALHVRQAFGLFVGLCLLASTLLIWLNAVTRWMALAGLGVAVLYPFTKRWTHFPQAVLGVAFSWGILMAFTAVRKTVPAEGWLLFLASFLWILAYDTLYAMVDRRDDLSAGIKSTAVLFGSADRLVVGLLQAGALIGFALVGVLRGFGVLFSAGLAAILALFIHQHILIRKREGPQCFRAFLANSWVGLALFVATVLELNLPPL